MIRQTRIELPALVAASLVSNVVKWRSIRASANTASEFASDDIATAAADPLVRAAFRERFAKFLTSATGSSTRITRAVLLDTPLSIDRGEVTDKGSINQRAVLEHRAALIETLYAKEPAAQVIAFA